MKFFDAIQVNEATFQMDKTTADSFVRELYVNSEASDHPFGEWIKSVFNNGALQLDDNDLGLRSRIYTERLYRALKDLNIEHLRRQAGGGDIMGMPDGPFEKVISFLWKHYHQLENRARQLWEIARTEKDVRWRTPLRDSLFKADHWDADQWLVYADYLEGEKPTGRTDVNREMANHIRRLIAI